jgi:hypothetical protein
MAVRRFLRDALFAMGSKTVTEPEISNKMRITNCGVQMSKALLWVSTE